MKEIVKVKGEVVGELDSLTVQVKVVCPFCGKEHEHGLGLMGSQTVRMAECAKGAYDIEVKK